MEFPKASVFIGQPGFLRLEDVLCEEWEPEKPELTDTMCRVIRFDGGTGTLKEFPAYFGCRPVVCCAKNHFIHGDYPGGAMHNLMREYPGSIGLFLQGAYGDVNTECVHREENESLLALSLRSSFPFHGMVRQSHPLRHEHQHPPRAARRYSSSMPGRTFM